MPHGRRSRQPAISSAAYSRLMRLHYFARWPTAPAPGNLQDCDIYFARLTMIAAMRGEASGLTTRHASASDYASQHDSRRYDGPAEIRATPISGGRSRDHARYEHLRAVIERHFTGASRPAEASSTARGAAFRSGRHCADMLRDASRGARRHDFTPRPRRTCPAYCRSRRIPRDGATPPIGAYQTMLLSGYVDDYDKLGADLRLSSALCHFTGLFRPEPLKRSRTAFAATLSTIRVCAQGIISRRSPPHESTFARSGARRFYRRWLEHCYIAHERDGPEVSSQSYPIAKPRPSLHCFLRAAEARVCRRWHAAAHRHDGATPPGHN